jgi:hypothetical protein
MGTHHTKPFAFSLAGLIALAVASPVAALVPGGGPPSSDCVSAWQVTTADVAANRGPTGVDCQDGDPACDADGEANGTCTFGVSVCTASVAVKGCTPDGVSAFTFSRKATKLGVTGPAVPTTEPVCGPATLIPVALKKTPQGFRQSRTVVLASTATTEHGRDRDTVRLRCVPNVGAGECPANPNGGPRELAMVVAASGTDLDNGVSGWSHNFPLPSGSLLRMCLTGCDPTTNPTCVEDDDATARVQHPTFGPPLPLFAANSPTCIVNRFDSAGLVGATADLATGAVQGDLHLMSDVYLSAPTEVCPQCSADEVGGTGTCTTGRREGQACRTEAIMEVSAAPAGSRQLKVSSDCLPSGSPQGTLSLTLPLTTSTAEMAGPHACGAKQEDGCSAGGSCDAVCTGSACVATTPDGQCVDANGGLAQLCCSNKTTLSCFPTRDGGSIVRNGTAGVPSPAWPEPTYPKTADATLVSTFCESATGSTVVDVVAGLPGPGALVLPVEQTWLP